jgi:magnesium and cobalt exporter, CNNM family
VGGYGVQVALVLVLVLLNAAFAGSEMALVSLRESQVQRLARTSHGGRVLARLARDPNRYLATVQIGITLAGFLASAAAAVSLAEPLVGSFGFLGSFAEPVVILLVTAVLSFITLVFGELAPKRLAMQRAERWAVLAARPLNVLATVSRPAVWLLGTATNLAVRLAGGDPHAARSAVTTEEIRDMIAAQAGFSAEQRTVISGAFDIADRVLREIVVPRRDVVFLPAGLPAGDGVNRLVASGHSRAPVTGPLGLDDVAGVVHLRDLVHADATVAEHAHPPLYLPETLKVSDALRQMRQQHEQFALVVDERGAVDGIVTLEDLVEEIVGEIYDEADRDVEAVVHEPAGSLLLTGAFPIHDLPDLGVEVGDRDGQDDGGFVTVAGLILARLGHIPTGPGERVDLGRYTAEVAEVTRHAITKVRLHPSASRAEHPGGADGSIGP